MTIPTGTIYKKNVFPSSKYQFKIIKQVTTQAKLGKWVTKGRLKGARMYTVTFEERKTCPKSCFHWNDCYGNTMPFAHRVSTNKTTMLKMWRELTEINKKPYPILIRLHVLGDFYSVEYVQFWRMVFDTFENIYCYGYTAYKPSTPIGKAIKKLRDSHWERFAIRYSNMPHVELSANSEDMGVEGIVCPEQLGATKDCGTCGLCWTKTKDNIIFKTHSRPIERKAV